MDSHPLYITGIKGPVAFKNWTLIEEDGSVLSRSIRTKDGVLQIKSGIGFQQKNLH